MTVKWITAVADLPARSFEQGSRFWQGVTGMSLSAPRGPGGEFATLLPARGDAFVRLQWIESGPGGCHLDLHVDDVSAVAGQAVRLGAQVRHEEAGFVVLSSPGGLAFCLVRHQGEAKRPAPVTWPGGHRSLVDQLSVDIPPAGYERECAFWSELTGWERVIGSRPEFQFLARPSWLPIRLLLQRLDSAGDNCAAHLDLACSDVAAERTRHEALGAEVVLTMPNWTTVRDPAGLYYCITRRDPDSGKL